MAAKIPDRTATAAPNAPPVAAEVSKVHDIVEYRVGLDDTLPPTPLKDLLSAGGANVYVLSTDAELCATVQRAGGEQYPVFTVDAWPALIEAIESEHCGIALVDVALLGKQRDKRIADLAQYAGHLVTLVAADRSDAQELIGFLSDRKIHRLLIKPPALGITRLLLESAVSRCIQLREHPPIEPVVTRTGLHRLAAAAPKVGGRVPAWVLATALVVLVLGAVVVAGLTQWWRPSAVAPVAGSAPPTETVEGAPPSVAAVAPAGLSENRFGDLLTRAETAFNEGRIADPPGDNALDYYLTILAAEPTHAGARDQMVPVLEALFAQAERALLDNSPETAAAALANVRRADPGSGRLAFLEAQLERARAAAAEEATTVATEQQAAATVQQPIRAAIAAATAAQAQPTELDSLLTIANARLERGQLVEPVGDSARAYLERAAQIDPGDRRVATARAELGAALVTTATAALNAGDLERATALATEARRFGGNAAALATIESGIAARRAALERGRHEELAATAAARVESGALVTPEGDSAFDYLSTLQSEGAELDELPALWDRLTGALATNARDAIAVLDWAGAKSWVAGLERTGRDVETAESLAREIATGELQEEYLATPAPASELTLASYTPPTYPEDALNRDIQGWVELDYVVDRRGDVRDVVAIAAEPSGRFERAAIAAVEQYRYEPFTRDGQTYERRLRLRVTFNLR